MGAEVAGIVSTLKTIRSLGINPKHYYQRMKQIAKSSSHKLIRF